MQSRVLKLLVGERGKEIFAEGGFEVEICDEAAGEFVSVTELQDSQGCICIEAKDWPVLREAIDQMVGEVQ